ncbi:hypothetical protein JTM05_32260, partial [Pseudomonas aeruginosa]|nr:hypothetical protein [Pseudomonas aeruginosa]
AEAIAQADLDRDALCGAEFVIGHGATPYRNGRVLHSVFAAAHLTATVGEHSRKAIVSLVEKSESQTLSSLDKALIKGMGNKFVREYLLQND